MKEKSFLNIIIFLLLVSILFVILYIFILIDIPAKFDKGYEIGLLIFNLCLSLIAASIFYFIIDFFPKKVRKHEILNSLEIHMVGIEDIYNSILINLNYDGVEIEQLNVHNVDKGTLKKAMLNTPLNYKTGVQSVPKENLTIFELATSKKGLVENEISEMEKHIDFLSTDLYKTMVELKRIDLTLIFRAGLVMVNRLNQQVINLEMFADELFKYIQKVKELRIKWDLNKKN